MEAIKYLGLKAIRDIVLSTPIMDAFKVSGHLAVIMDKQWNHAFYTNKVLVFLYEKFFRKKLSEIEGNAGLLHNIGCAFLIKHRHIDYLAIKKRAALEDRFDSELERDVLGFTHCEAGGYLLSWWDLPYPIVECALYHHTPFDKRIINKELVMSVHLAQKYAYELIAEKNVESFFPEVYEALSVDRDKFDHAISDLND
jgi:HD-like signal output (HDOD) protein